MAATEITVGHVLLSGRCVRSEGLKAPAGKGLVESRTRRGTIAVGNEHWDVLDRDVLAWMALALPDHEFLIGLVEARTIFEPATARLAANRATPAQILQIEFSRVLVGHLRAGLAHPAAVASMVFAGISGSSTADPSAIASIVIPTMKRSGYKAGFAAALIACASGFRTCRASSSKPQS